MRLEPTRCALDEHVNQNWTLTVEPHVTVEDVLHPEFLANVSARMRPYDHVRVRTDTGEWYAELLVLSCGRTWAKMVLLYKIDLTTKDVDLTQAAPNDEYIVQYRGPHLRFCVTRKSDRSSIKEQCQSKEEANTWLADYIRTTSTS